MSKVDKMKKKWWKVNLLLFFVLVFFFCTIQPIFAHKVTVFAWKEGDRVFTESRFSGGKRVKNGRIEVYDDSGKKLMEGVTDDQGCFSFLIPEEKSLDIVLKAGAGHQGHWEIPAESSEKENNAVLEKTKKQEGVQANPEELEAIVEKVMDKKLKPVITMLMDQQDSDPSVTDIIGGIGYIIGLTGLAAWFSGRSRKGR
jgi:nickel transport protein